jgi:methylene-tetrahydromethanopterin dehydrogenase
LRREIEAMADKHILHMVTPLKHMSPFDVNMAADAGFDTIVTYTGVTLEEVGGLVQDAIFSRPPQSGVNTAFFFAGKDAVLALEMLEAARKAMVPPFEISLFADPAGSFTTAAGMVACVERSLKRKGESLKGQRVAVFGATGVVGYSSAVIAALEGARVTLVGYDGTARVERASAEIAKRFAVETQFADGSSDARKRTIAEGSTVVLCAARAGVKVLDDSTIDAAKSLLIAADVNAVPPPGIAGLEMMADDQKLGQHGAVGIGPLTIGNVKYRTESGLFRQMIAAKKPVSYDFRDAFILARSIAQA